MSDQLAASLIMGCLLLALALGVPVAFALAGVALVFAIVLLGPAGAWMIVNATWSQISSQTMLAIPLFVMMASTLELSGIGEALFEGVYKWFGSIRGGLAIAVVLASTLLAAITGLAATSIAMLGIIAIPAMYKHGYSKELVLGVVPAGGVLGPIIPPSIYMIILATMSEQSVGRLFMGGVGPGLLISALFCGYILIRSRLQPWYAPAAPLDERFSWKEKLSSLKGIVLPICLILGVLGTMYVGIATVTEAASIGAFGALLICIIQRQFTWARLGKTVDSAFLLTALIMWIAIGGTLFAGVIRASGAGHVISGLMASLPLGTVGMVSIMLAIGLILGLVMDGLAIIFITVPTFAAIAQTLGVDMTYFLVLYTVVIAIGGISPPFGVALFFLSGIVPDEKISDIMKAAVPFTAVMVVGLFLAVAFPQVILWLPNHMS